MAYKYIHSNDRMIYADLIRDGGSAAIGIRDGEHRIHIRVMRNRKEQTGNDYNKIEISDETGVLDIVDHVEDVPGLRDFMIGNKSRIRDSVWNIFISASRILLNEFIEKE